MKKITASELRQKYFEFFKSKGHALISSASLIPENDPTVLFTTAGMHPLVPYLMGEKHPVGKRLVDIQKSLRTDDIDEVGDTTHQTFFEMLGNWSLGDYFKKEAIEYSWEFLTSPQWLGIKPEFLAVSVFAGDQDAPRDEEAAGHWLRVSGGELEGRIDYLPKDKNWWGPAGKTGPCGPDTEMFYWVGKDAPPKKIKAGDLADSPEWEEIWNDVFMQYNKKEDGSYEPLKQQNVDTGMGLERTLAVLNGLDDNYQTELFLPIIGKIEELTKKKYLFSKGDLGFDEMPECWKKDMKSMRVVADHLRSAVFILAEKLEPANIDRGYILRRLIRRAVRHGKQLGIEGDFCVKIAKVVVENYEEAYPELKVNQEFIFEQLKREEEKFGKTLENGLKEAEKIRQQNQTAGFEIGYVSGAQASTLYQSYGFPVEMIKEEFPKLDEKAFQDEFKKHQELSRTASSGQFKGGLADNSENTKKYHTTTHLLQAALRKILGNHVFQKGSNNNAERLRFDFPHPNPITQEELKQIEDLVNQKIKEALPVHFEEMSVAEAKEKSALGVFESKYGEKVKVYFIGNEPDYFSIEICGGPHVENTKEIGGIKIQKVESIGQGTKRIKVVLA